MTSMSFYTYRGVSPRSFRPVLSRRFNATPRSDTTSHQPPRAARSPPLQADCLFLSDARLGDLDSPQNAIFDTRPARAPTSTRPTPATGPASRVARDPRSCWDQQYDSDGDCGGYSQEPSSRQRTGGRRARLSSVKPNVCEEDTDATSTDHEAFRQCSASVSGAQQRASRGNRREGREQGGRGEKRG